MLFVLKNIVDMLSNPQDALFGKLSIVFDIICSSTSFNAETLDRERVEQKKE